MVEHNLSVVANLSHRITVLTRGRVLAEGDYATVSNNPEVREAYHGGRACLTQRHAAARGRGTCRPGTASRTSCTA